jgi:serine/threonine protein kinase
MLSVPGLVALLGTFLTFSGDAALRSSSLGGARAHLADQTQLASKDIRHTLAQSDPLLDRLAVLVRSHEPSQAFDVFAHTMADLMRGRPGVRFVSVSFPDGTFQGAALDHKGVIGFQDSRVDSDGTRRRAYELVGTSELRLVTDERTAYDPRERGFYRQALERNARIWTQPYPFYGTNFTGVTRAEAVYTGARDERRLRAVITVDFDVKTLSSHLADLQLEGARALLYTTDGTLLAYPSGASAFEGSVRPDRVLRYDDLRDPVLSLFFSEGRKSRPAGFEAGELTLAGDRFLTSVAPATSDPSLGWFVAYIVPTGQFLRPAHTQARRSLLIGSLSVLAAMLAGWLIARNIVRARREVATARAEALEARQTAQQLGQYVLEQKLGEGGMGVVYRARHALLRRPTAIKLLAPDQVGEQALERFAREVRLTARLAHPNTVTIYDYGHTPEGTFYYAMELLDGSDLENLVTRTGPVGAARVRHILIQVAGALAEAHAIGLIHRDIKPGNVMLCHHALRDDVAKLLDFGLVKELGDLALDGGEGARSAEPRTTPAEGTPDPDRTRTGVRFLVGTPHYMAPEAIVKPEAVGPRSDLYSLGALAYFLLVGKPVFEGATIGAVCEHHLHSCPVAPSVRLGRAIPAGLERIVLECLAKDPAQRAASASSLVDALTALDDVETWTTRDAREWWQKQGRLDAEHAPSAALDVASTLQVAGIVSIDMSER